LSHQQERPSSSECITDAPYVRDGNAIWHFRRLFKDLTAEQQWMVLDLDENPMSQNRCSTDPDGLAGVFPADGSTSQSTAKSGESPDLWE